jgi:S-adenosylmethionine:tRNA-ribosyltransferase-isomerase (queuine synthetase)
MDRSFAELPSLIQADDLLVFNDTQVVKRQRLYDHKASGERLELLIERVLDVQTGRVAAHMKVSEKPAPVAVLQTRGRKYNQLINTLVHFYGLKILKILLRSVVCLGACSGPVARDVSV